MSDLENTSETQNETTQPAEVVATGAEEVNQPQVNDTDDVEFYVEEEGSQEQPKNNMSQEQAYAAFRKEQDKRKRKQKEIDSKNNEINELKTQVSKLSETVGSITKGAPPTMESCGFDEDEFQTKTREYYAPTQSKPSETEQPVVNQQNEVSDQAEFYLYQKEQELSKHIPTYEADKSELVGKFKQYGGGEDTIQFMSQIAQQKGVDIAKAILAMNKTPSLVNDLVQAAQSNNQFAIADVIEKAASKVQTRQRKPIDTQPEPTINSSGPIDNTNKAIEKARSEWVNASAHEKLNKWNSYQAIKKQNKVK